MKIKPIVPLSLLLVLASPSKAYAIEDTLVQDVLSQDTMQLEEKVMTDTQMKYSEIGRGYLERKTKPPKAIIRITKDRDGNEIKQIYNCSGYVQEFYLKYFKKEWCIERGLMKRDARSGGTWNIVENIKDKGYQEWVNDDTEIIELKKQYRIASKKGNEKKKKEIVKKLEQKNTREFGENLMPLDVLSLWYKDSHYNKHDLTHLCVYLGGGKVLQQWGTEVEIMSLEDLYKRTPAGIERVFRFSS